MNSQQKIKLFLLDTRERISALEQAFNTLGIRDLAITSYDEHRVSRTPIANIALPSKLPQGFHIYMLYTPLTTDEAILGLREDEPKAFIWLNSAKSPWQLGESLKQNVDGYYSPEEPEIQVKRIMGAWREAPR